MVTPAASLFNDLKENTPDETHFFDGCRYGGHVDSGWTTRER
jgi:hypothetical protein